MNRLDATEKRAMSRAFRDRTPDLGVYSVECDAIELIVLRAVRNLEAAMQRERFELRIGQHRDSRLQAVWRQYGEQAVRFNVLEVIKADTTTDEDPLDALEEARIKWSHRLQPAEGTP